MKLKVSTHLTSEFSSVPGPMDSMPDDERD